MQELENQRKQIENRIRDHVLDVRRSGQLGLEEGRTASKEVRPFYGQAGLTVRWLVSP